MQAKPVGILLRQWRERRRMSQLELSIQAEISTRHLSFLETGRSAPIRAAVRQLLASHEPYPALVVDRSWNLVEANNSLTLFTSLVAPHLLAPPANVLRASLHPEGLAPHIVNLGEWRGHLLHRVRRIVEITGDREIAELAAELESYPCDQPVLETTLPGPGEIMIPMRLRFNDTELSFFSMVATFGTPLDVTLSELAIESFFPADATTARLLQPS